MKKIQDVDLKGKKVLLRVDFNVAIENQKIQEKFKIEAAKETLKFLLQKGAKVAMVSHLGRPIATKTLTENSVEKNNLEFSFREISKDISDILGVDVNFFPDCIGEGVVNKLGALEENQALLLENVRFYKGEEKNEEDFSKKLAENFDVFVNDAFSVSHRDQSSLTGVTKFLDSYAGFRLQKEIAEMEKIKNNFSRPAAAIIGGAKIETKLPVIEFFERNYDFVLVGGKIANEALDQKMVFSEKVILPVDFAGDRFDIGKLTIEKFKKIISGAKTVVWNGPLGMFEKEEFSKGTYEILDAILENEKSYFMIGGGETLEALEKKQAMEKASFVSTGGGAMLAYLGGEKMPGILSLVD
jgi:phosphoglycerate kinase